MSCGVPPAGWCCTRQAGHAGPCAAQPVEDEFPTAAVPPPPPLPSIAVPEDSQADTERPAPSMVRPVTGEQVLYVLSAGPRKGERRPAMVVRVLDASGKARLAVFTDGEGDGRLYQSCPTLVTAEYAEPWIPGTWHRY